MSIFIGRSHELQTLNRLWGSPKAALLVVYGRRRVGKTRLLTHWLQEIGERKLYWMAEPSSVTDQLRSFSQAVYRFALPGVTVPETFSYASWEQALTQLVAVATTEKAVVILDEFTYLLANKPEIAGIFQKVWDQQMQASRLMLVLCGSHLGMMQRHVLAYQAPLYGRATAQLHVQPLPFGVTSHYFPNYAAAERVAVYAMFGGIPAYWERLNQAISISDNIRQQLLTPNNLMQAEPRLLLHDFVREPDNYMAILKALANNYRTQKEIMTFTGLAQGHVSKYLSVLEAAGFIERRIPATAAVRSRRSRYHITDPYLRFYFRFLVNRQEQLALQVIEPALAEIKKHLLDFIGTHTWEELGREWTLRAGARGILPFLPDKVGTVWTKKAQVDVVGVNNMEKTLILGECKWSPDQMGWSVMQQLVAKTDEVIPAGGAWRVYYVGLARGGWTAAARQAVETFHQSPMAKGARWQAVGARLVDLDQVDADLAAWSH